MIETTQTQDAPTDDAPEAFHYACETALIMENGNAGIVMEIGASHQLPVQMIDGTMPFATATLLDLKAAKRAYAALGSVIASAEAYESGKTLCVECQRPTGSKDTFCGDHRPGGRRRIIVPNKDLVIAGTH